MARHTIKRTARICFDILLFCLVWFGEYAIQKWFVPYRRGFFCNDESLAYPYREGTLSVLEMSFVVFLVPPLIMIAIELFKHIEPYMIAGSKRKKSSSPIPNGTPSSATDAGSGCCGGGGALGCHLGYRLMQCYKHIGYYLFGLGLNLLAVEVFKFSVGRLRPHFFAVCQPQMHDGTTCDDDINQGRYIMDYTCVGQNISAAVLKQVNQSFLSGHSSILFYSMMYLCIYLQAALSTRASKLLKHVLQFVFIMFAMFIAMTRVSDYWHHWSDVLSGIVLGIIMAIVVAHYMTELFIERRHTRYIGTFKTHAHKATPPGNSTSSSTAKSMVLPAYTFGTIPYVHYAPPHHAQYSHATYQNYGYVP